MRSSNHFRIAILPGDGIGKEVMSACVEVLDRIQRRVGGFKLDLEYIHAGAEYFLEEVVDITEEAMGKVKQADAILLGAMGPGSQLAGSQAAGSQSAGCSRALPRMTLFQ